MIDALLAALLAGIDPSIVTLLPGALAGLPPAKVAWLIHGEALTCEGAWLVDVAACAGLPMTSDSPVTPVGSPKRTGMPKTSSACSTAPSILAPPPVITIPAGTKSSKPERRSSEWAKPKISS